MSWRPPCSAALGSPTRTSRGCSTTAAATACGSWRTVSARAYVTRPDNRHAKAGNINHALGVLGGELLLVLDADHVPQPDILHATVGYFDDPRLGLVQTPHDFSNQDSFQHFATGKHDQSMFFEVILPGKDRHGGVFWCGSAAVIRREALLEVGGVATETIAEDFHTTIKMHGGVGRRATTTRPWSRAWLHTTCRRSSCSETGGHAATWRSSRRRRTRWWHHASRWVSGSATCRR